MPVLADILAPLTRTGAQRCPTCAYDTAGLEDPTCPECGSGVDPHWRDQRPPPGSILRRRAPVLAAAFTAVQTLLGLAVVVALCLVMAHYARFGAVTPANVASAAVAFALSLTGAGATWMVIANRHRIAHGHIAWFWTGVSAPLTLLALGLIAWALSAALIPR